MYHLLIMLIMKFYIILSDAYSKTAIKNTL